MGRLLETLPSANLLSHSTQFPVLFERRPNLMISRTGPRLRPGGVLRIVRSSFRIFRASSLSPFFALVCLPFYVLSTGGALPPPHPTFKSGRLVRDVIHTRWKPSRVTSLFGVTASSGRRTASRQRPCKRHAKRRMASWRPHRVRRQGTDFLTAQARTSAFRDWSPSENSGAKQRGARRRRSKRAIY